MKNVKHEVSNRDLFNMVVGAGIGILYVFSGILMSAIIMNFMELMYVLYNYPNTEHVWQLLLIGISVVVGVIGVVLLTVHSIAGQEKRIHRYYWNVYEKWRRM